MTKNIAIAALLALVLLLGCALVRVENQRYAMAVGLCALPEPGAWDWKCLAKTETRTGWWWHLFYAVKDTL